MKTEDLIHELRKTARMFSGERLWLLLKEAAEQLSIYTAGTEARILTLEEIEKAPEYCLLWEETKIDWRACQVKSLREDKIEIEIAPVEKRGNTLYGTGKYTEISQNMFGEPGDQCQTRYWSGRPTDAQREATPWNV